MDLLLVYICFIFYERNPTWFPRNLVSARHHGIETELEVVSAFESHERDCLKCQRNEWIHVLSPFIHSSPTRIFHISNPLSAKVPHSIHCFIGSLLDQTFEKDAVKVSTTKRPIDQPFKLIDVFSEEFRGLMIQWVVGVGLVEEVNESINDRVDIQDRSPIFT